MSETLLDFKAGINGLIEMKLTPKVFQELLSQKSKTSLSLKRTSESIDLRRNKLMKTARKS